MKKTAARPTIYLYLPAFAGGGAERVFLRLANHYEASGIAVGLVVNDAAGPLRALLHPDVPVVALDEPRALRALPKLAGFLRRERPLALISAMTKVNMTAILARAMAGVPTRLVTSERNQVSMQMREAGVLGRWLFHAALRLLYRHADHLTAVTDEVAADIARLSGVRREHITIVHNPTPDPGDIARARANPLPHPWFAEPDPVVVAIGRLVPQKGFQHLLQALAMVRQRCPARLIILGEGPLLDELTEAARRLGVERAVAFPGFAENRLDYLVNASLYVLSSDFEGFPNALLEALACDLPVVSTDCAGGGARTILGADAADAIVAAGAPDQLAEAMVRQLERPRRSGESLARAERFSMRHTAETFLGLAVGPPP